MYQPGLRAPSQHSWIMQGLCGIQRDGGSPKLADLVSGGGNLLDTPNLTKGPNSDHILLCDESLLVLGLKNNPILIHSITENFGRYIFEKLGKAYLCTNLVGVRNRPGRWPGVKATLYTLLIRRNVIGCGYGAAVADRI